MELNILYLQVLVDVDLVKDYFFLGVDEVYGEEEVRVDV